MSVVKGLINTLADPRLFFMLAVTSLVVLVWKREKIAANSVGYGLLGILAVFFIFGSFDPNFRLIVTKPDNVPIGASWQARVRWRRRNPIASGCGPTWSTRR